MNTKSKNGQGKSHSDWTNKEVDKQKIEISNIDLLNNICSYDLPPTLVDAYFDPNKNKMGK